MSRPGNPALRKTSNKVDVIAVIRLDTTHMNAVSLAQNLAGAVEHPEELEDEGPTLLQSRNSEVDQ